MKKHRKDTEVVGSTDTAVAPPERLSETTPRSIKEYLDKSVGVSVVMIKIGDPEAANSTGGIILEKYGTCEA